MEVVLVVEVVYLFQERLRVRILWVLAHFKRVLSNKNKDFVIPVEANNS